MKTIVVTQKKLLPLRPFDVYINGDFSGKTSRFHPLTLSLDCDEFDISIKNFCYSGTAHCKVERNISTIEYETIDSLPLFVSAAFDILVVIIVLFNISPFPVLWWLYGIFGIPVVIVFFNILNRKRYFKIKVSSKLPCSGM